MLKVIEYIKLHPNWKEELQEKPYYLRITEDDGLIMLKYSQIDSDFNNDIVRECRGIILDSEFNVVCMGFEKFFNWGEGFADDIDWDSAVVQEKIDGSLIKVFYCDGSWRVATNGTINAYNAPTRDETFDSFGELFEHAFYSEFGYMSDLNKDFTYMFELCSPYTRIVVPHEEIKLYHIGTRNNKTLQEVEVDIGIQKPKTYQCKTLDDVIKLAEVLPYNEEGYVVRDKNYNRIKVKSPAYVAAHHMINGFNEKRAFELIKLNEHEEFINYFPEYKEYFYKLEKLIRRFSEYSSYLLRSIVGSVWPGDRKAFAQKAKNTFCPAVLFSLLDGKYKNPTEWLYSLPTDKALEHLKRLE